MTKPRLWGILAVTMFAAISPSCTDFHDESTTVPSEDLVILAELGFDTRTAFKLPDGFLVNGDIFISEDHIAEYLSLKMGPETRQRYYGDLYKLSSPTQTVYILNDNALFHSALEEAFVEACQAWSGIRGAAITFEYVYGSDLRPSDYVNAVKLETCEPWESWMPEYQHRNSIVTYVGPPHSGKPYRLMINDQNSLYRTMTHSKKVWAMAHALGHVIGLGHTDESGNGNNGSGSEFFPSIIITGTPSSDASSVMNNNNFQIKDWEGLSEGDIEALKILYPGNLPQNVKISIKVDSDGSSLLPTKEYKFTAEVADPESWFPDPMVKFDFEGTYNTMPAPEIVSTGDLSTAVKFHEKGFYTVKATLLGSDPVISARQNYVVNCDPGSIESTVYIENGSATINSVSDAVCHSPQASYIWRVDFGDGWTDTDLTGNSVTVASSGRFITKYRRIHVCESGTAASNDCTVIDNDLLATLGGKIPEIKLLNSDRWYFRDELESIEPASPELGEVSYQWEIDRGDGWKIHTLANAGPSLEIDWFEIDQAYLRRKVISRYGEAYSNVCFFQDMFYPNYGGLGSEQPLLLGEFSADFSVRNAIDLSHEGFRNVDQSSNYGNDGFLAFTIHRPFRVKIVLSHFQVGDIWLALQKGEINQYGWFNADEYIHDGVFAVLDGEQASIPTFDQLDEYPGGYKEFDLEPGTYQLHVQCSRGTNGGTTDKIVYYHIIGTAR